MLPATKVTGLRAPLSDAYVEDYKRTLKVRVAQNFTLDKTPIKSRVNQCAHRIAVSHPPDFRDDLDKRWGSA